MCCNLKICENGQEKKKQKKKERRPLTGGPYDQTNFTVTLEKTNASNDVTFCCCCFMTVNSLGTNFCLVPLPGS